MTPNDNIFVTGATGFVGRHLIASLLKDGLSVYALSRDDNNGLDKKVKIVKGDITARIDLPEDISTIFHCAGIWSDSDAPSEKERMERVNIGGTQRVVEVAMKKQCRLIHLGTAYVVGQADKDHIDETVECHPRTFYEQTKYEAEKVVRRGIEQGLRAQVLRPTFIFGVGRNVVDDPFLQLLIAIKTGRYKNICKGRGIYNIVHVDEVVHALCCLDDDALPNGGLFFINTPISFHDLSMIVKFATNGGKSKPGSLPYPLVFLAAGVFTLIAAITGRRMPLTFSRLKTLTNEKVFSQERLLKVTTYRLLSRLEERIIQVCRDYSDRGFLN